VTDDDLVRVEGVAVGYDHQAVLRDVHLRLVHGCFAGLLGANGSGKTTLLKTILGILPPLEGRVVYHRIQGRDPVFGYVPQREALDAIFLFTSFEVALMGVCGRVGPGRFINHDERAWVRHCLSETGAADLARRRFSELSGGQKQRVLIARALAVRPHLLLLDEPTTGLDPAAAEAIVELLKRIHTQRNLTMLMVSHDLPIVRRCVQEVIWLRDGKATQGRVEELLTRDQVERALGLEFS
jgi:ABC-type Mn2+/Zn2+ transport system ATPase subunit